MNISNSELKTKFVGEELAIAKDINKTEEEIIAENIEEEKIESRDSGQSD